MSTILGGIAAGLFEAPSISKTAKHSSNEKISTLLEMLQHLMILEG